MAKSRIETKVLVLLICVFFLGISAYAQELPSINNESKLLEFSQKSEKAIVGQLPDLDVSFSSVLEKEDYVVVDIRLRGKKQLIALLNFKDEIYRIRFISLESGELVKLTKGDLQTFHVLGVTLSRHFPSLGMPKAAEALSLTLYFVELYLQENYPANELLDISTEGQKKRIRPEAWTSFCDSIGDEITGTYDIEEGVPITESETVGPCASGGCLGRCGIGCGSAFPGDHPLLQRFTLDCFNHDLCTRATGNIFRPCADEFWAAADDYWNAANCNEITDDWTVDMTGTSCFEGDCADIHSVKIYHFQSTGTLFRGISDPSPIDGGVSGYQGTVSDENQTSGQWRIPTYMDPEYGGLDCQDIKLPYLRCNHLPPFIK